MTATIEDDRDTIRGLLLKSEEQIRKDPDVANATTAEAEQIAAPWVADGKIVELLSPLLANTEDKAVRFGAASYLLNHGHSDLAVPVLENIGGWEAKVLLLDWRSNRAKQG